MTTTPPCSGGVVFHCSLLGQHTLPSLYLSYPGSSKAHEAGKIDYPRTHRSGHGVAGYGSFDYEDTAESPEVTSDRPAMFRPTTYRYFNTVRFFVGLSLTIALLSCQTAHAPAPQARAIPKPSIRVHDLEQRIHVLINRERKIHGLSTLGWDGRLARIARDHSKDMASRSYFSHESPEGHDFSFRYREQGFACSIRTGNIVHSGAENIALGHLYRSIRTVNGVVSYDWYTLEQLAQKTVQGWMNSPGHRKNILTPHWLSQGVGSSFAPDGTVYVTQNFC